MRQPLEKATEAFPGPQGCLLSELGKVLRWTFKNDFVEPLPELVLLLCVISVASHNFLNIGASDLFSSLTWNLDVLLLIFVGIGGAMSYSMALERGQLAQQFLSLRTSRTKFVLLKWTSLFIIFVALALPLDFAAFFLYMGYFPSLPAYSAWPDAPMLTFLIAVLEQMIFLAFLNSLVMAISFSIQRTTVSLLIFLAVGLFSAGYLSLGSVPIPDYLRLGYGDYLIVSSFSAYGFDLLYRPAAVVAASMPTVADLLALAYRSLGAFALFVVGLWGLVRADLD